ncbi:MAG: porin [Pseudomonadota bacterium]
MKHTALPLALCTAALGLPLTGQSAAPMPSPEQMWEIIQQQQQEIEALKRQQQATERKADAADEKAEAAVDAVESDSSGSGGWAERTRIGGYGELHYYNIDASDSANDVKELDFKRFVLFAGHEFTDDIRFFSEIELEHSIAGEGQNGEFELEQAYLEFDLRDNLQARGGLFLLPVGILNETHEPNTFYGVERNDVESIIIPATWWAGGAGLSGRHANGISWDLAVHEGLRMDTTSFRVRDGRQKTSEARADDLAWSGRLRYTGIPGLELAASANYQTDASQVGGDGLDSGLLLETHLVYEKGPFGLRALYARWDFDGAAVAAADADRQTGWYLEPSYRVRSDIGLYARYEDVAAARSQDRFDQWEIGVNYWPHPDVVIKADYRSRDHDLAAEAGRDFDAFDLGIGYQF